MKEIAASISAKPASVCSYRSRILTKLGTNNVASLLRLSIRYGLIRP
jgi:DNA-binding CsgD family transcriptional regulator